MPNVEISDNAIKRIKYLLTKKEPGTVLHIEVIGGGCSGFQYNYKFIPEPEDVKNYFIVDRDGVRVIIDDSSINFLEGSLVDYVETLGSAAFEIKNPNAASSCGCGNSFSV